MTNQLCDRCHYDDATKEWRDDDGTVYHYCDACYARYDMMRARREAGK